VRETIKLFLCYLGRDSAIGASLIVIERFWVCYIATSCLLFLWRCVVMPLKRIYYFYNRL